MISAEILLNSASLISALIVKTSDFAACSIFSFFSVRVSITTSAKAEKAKALALVEQQKAEKAKALALTEQQKAKDLKAEAEKYNDAELLKRFKNRISFWGNILAILTICGLGAALYHIYGWRKYYINGNAVKLPEQLYEENEKKLSDMKEKTNELFEKIINLTKKIANDGNVIAEKNEENSEEINRQISSLIDQAYEEKEKRKDLEKGYHNNILKNFVSRLLEIRKRLAYYVEGNNTSEEIKNIMTTELNKLDRFLEGEGVHKIVLEQGDSLKGPDGKYLDGLDMREGVETEDKDLQGTVIETLEIGFYLENSDGKKDIIQPAEIKFYNEGENIEESSAEEIIKEETPIVDISENQKEK